MSSNQKLMLTKKAKNTTACVIPHFHGILTAKSSYQRSLWYVKMIQNTPQMMKSWVKWLSKQTIVNLLPGRWSAVEHALATGSSHNNESLRVDIGQGKHMFWKDVDELWAPVWQAQCLTTTRGSRPDVIFEIEVFLWKYFTAILNKK